MGLFKKKKVKQEIASQVGPELPQLPELPKLPDFPTINSHEETSNQLPSFPQNPIGEDFSKNVIKNAISGEREGEEANAGFVPPSLEEHHGPQKAHLESSAFHEELKPQTHSERPVSRDTPEEPKKIYSEPKRPQTMYVRIDKFEEGIRLFEKIKNKINDIEKMFGDIKKIKDQEEKDLDAWEQELKSIKEKIQRLNQEIFSKLE